MLPNWSADLTNWFENEEDLRHSVLFPAYRAAVKLTIGKILGSFISNFFSVYFPNTLALTDPKFFI